MLYIKNIKEIGELYHEVGRYEMKKYYRQAIAFLLVWFCSGVTMYLYQVENKILGITFTLLSFLYWFIIDKDE